MTLTVSALNAAVTGLDIAAISLHTGDPGTGTANEITGGSYARQNTTFGAAANGQRVSTQVTFSIPPATTVAWVVVWNAAKTVAQDIVQLPTPESYGSGGEFKYTHTVKVENPPAV